MFENVDGRTDDGRTTDARVTGILIAHLGAFGSGELISRGLEKRCPGCLFFLAVDPGTPTPPLLTKLPGSALVSMGASMHQ